MDETTTAQEQSATFYTMQEVDVMRLNFGRYQYFPKNVVISIDDSYRFNDGSVTYMNLYFDYTQRSVPVIQMGIEMDRDMIALIYANKNKAQVALTIDEYQVDIDGRIIGTTNFIQHTFGLIPARDQTVYITSTDSATDKKTDLMKILQHFEMYLVDMDAVNWFKMETDIVLEKATYGGMLLTPMILRDIPAKKAIVTPPVQSGTVENITTPVGTLIDNIRHLNNTYGIYPGEPIIFWDLEHFYCLCKQKPNVTFKEEDVSDYGTVSFILKNPDKADNQVRGSCNDRKRKTHWINLNKEPSIYDTRTKDSYAKFSTLTTVTDTGEVDKTTLDQNATAMMYVYAINSLSEQRIKNETIFGPMVGLVAQDISVRFLKPYKEYTFVTDTSYTNLDLDGHIFRILGWHLAIEREGRTKYINQTSITLFTPDSGYDLEST